MILCKDNSTGEISYVTENSDGSIPHGFTVLTASEITAYEQARSKNKRRSEIIARLNKIDFESVRPVRAIQAGNGMQADTDKINALDTEALELRTELSGL